MNIYALAGERGPSFKGHLEMRSAMGASVAVIEVEKTKGTLEPALPGRT